MSANRSDDSPADVPQDRPDEMRATEQSVVLTADQVAARLTVSRRTLERLIAAGDFPSPLKIGRASRFHPGDIATYLETLRRKRGDKIGTS